MDRTAWSFVSALDNEPHSDCFSNVYYRNHKGKSQGGKKNLKCFPGCSDGIHRASWGFCGQAVRVAHTSPETSSSRNVVYGSFFRTT